MSVLIERMGIRAGEGRLVSMVLAYGFSLGLGRLFCAAAISGMFLDLFGARALPYTFIGTALVVPITGLAYLRARSRMPLARLIALTVGLLMVALLVFRVALDLSRAPWLVMTLMIGYTTVYVLVTLSFWGLTGQLFNVRQGKRLFGLLSVGIEVASIGGGLLTILLAPLIGSPNLLLLASASMLAALLVERVIVRRHSLGADTAATGDGGAEAPSAKALLAGGYVRLILALVALSQLGYFFVENIFYEFSMPHFSGPDQFTALVGATVASSSLLTIILQVTAVGPLISRFGVRGVLPLLPVVLLVCAAVVSLSGAIFGGIFAVFVLMLITRVVERALRFSVDETSAQIIYQPLLAAERSLLQTLADGGVKPLTAGVAGVLILVCTRLLGFGSVQLAALLALLAAVWIAVAVVLGRSYPTALLRALGGRQLGGLDLRLDDGDSLAILWRGLRSPYPGEALYALQLLTDLEHASLPDALADLLGHPDAGVRRTALRRIANDPSTALRGPVAELLDRETDLTVRGQALRTLAALGAAPPELLASAFADPEPELRLGAAVALAAIGGGVSLAPQLRSWAGSANVTERILAARAIGEIDGLAGGNLLRPLLNDTSTAVRQAALASVATTGDAALWPEAVAALASPALRSEALASLTAGGEAALPALGEALSRADLPIGLRLQVARAAGRLGPGAGELLVAQLDTPVEELRHGVVSALNQCGYRAAGPMAERVWGRVRAEAAEATWALAARRDLGDDPASAPLRAALAGSALRAKQRMLALLGALADQKTLRQVREGLSRGADQQAYAIETLDLLLPQALRPIMLPLVEAVEPGPALAALERSFPQERYSAEERLEELASAAVARSYPWIRICALAAARRPDVMIEPLPELHLFERVQLLSGSATFHEVPAEELLAVAELLEPVRFPAGAAVFTQGEPGSCAYLIASGRVQAHDGQRVLSELGPHAIIGELSALDARPRSLSVRAAEPSELLRLDQEALFELIADHVTVARGIIGVLIRNLRSNIHAIEALDLQLQAVLPRDG